MVLQYVAYRPKAGLEIWKPM